MSHDNDPKFRPSISIQGRTGSALIITGLLALVAIVAFFTYDVVTAINIPAATSATSKAPSPITTGSAR